MKKWLFLRGEFDSNNNKNLEDDTDMWIQLFYGLVEQHDRADLWYLKKNTELIKTINGNMVALHSDLKSMLNKNVFNIDLEDYTHVFARGGFDYYIPILKACKNAFKIRYGAGERFMPEIKYDMVLIDTERQRKKVLKKYPDSNVKLLIKPAALNFKPVAVENKFDVCYIANQQQKNIKGIDFVYKTVPRDISVLHLGHHNKLRPPANVTCRRVDRTDMPTEISRCRIGIVPYGKKDSCPRALVEMMACGLPLVMLPTVNCSELYKYGASVVEKSDFWETVRNKLKNHVTDMAKYYEENLSLNKAVENILEGI